jgi:branched-chain amino acid transport system substrate-binding protein
VHLLAILAVLGIVLSGCPSPAAEGADRSGTPLRIGISLSLTGDFADPGKAAKRGYDLWAKTVNAKGGVLGRQVELKIIDDTSSPEMVVTNYEKLITKDKVDLVFGPFSSLLTFPASKVVARHRYAFLEPAGGAKKIFDQYLGNLFFVQPAPSVYQGDVFADYILSLPADKRPKTAAYPALDDPFAVPIVEHVRARFEDKGIRTVFKEVYPAETAMPGVMTRVAAANPDVVVAGTQSEDAYLSVRSMVQKKWAPKWLYMSNGANSPAVFPGKVGPTNVNGIFSSGDWFPLSKAAGSKEFVEGYLKAYGGHPDAIDNTSVEAYSCGLLIEQVAAKTGKVDNATIIESLHTGVWRTPVGDLSWDASGAPLGSYVLIQWIDGKLMPVYPTLDAQHYPMTTPLPWMK